MMSIRDVCSDIWGGGANVVQRRALFKTMSDAEVAKSHELMVELSCLICEIHYEVENRHGQVWKAGPETVDMVQAVNRLVDWCPFTGTFGQMVRAVTCEATVKAYLAALRAGDMKLPHLERNAELEDLDLTIGGVTVRSRRAIMRKFKGCYGLIPGEGFQISMYRNQSYGYCLQSQIQNFFDLIDLENDERIELQEELDGDWDF